MIIVNLKGGLGNQMFQYALGRKLALQNSDVLKLDVTGLDRAHEVGDVYRPFVLGELSIQKEIASEDEIRKLKYSHGAFSKCWRWFSFKILRHMHVGWEPEILKKTGDMYLDGFWQSPKYFEDIRDVLLKDFSLKKPFSEIGRAYADKIQNSTAVAVHVRRGDYVENPKVRSAYGECSQEYYKKAVDQVSSQVIDPMFFVFSDDVEWVKNNLDLGESTEYVSREGMSDAEAMMLMSMCKHNIIANSTFGWWGAWLNTNPEKMVIAPKPWFNENGKQFLHLIPHSWIRIPKQ
jgi:hypothetical protein